MKKLLYLIITVVLCMSEACQYDSFNSKDDEADSLKVDSSIHIAIVPIDEAEPFCLAYMQGWFDSLGIEVTIDTFMSAMDADTAFVNGSSHLLLTDSVRAAYLSKVCPVSNDSDSVAVLCTDTLRLSLMTGKSARIKNIKSLKDKIIAVTRNSAVDHTADLVMKAAQMKNEELNRPQINDIGLRANMLGLDQYDGAILPEPYATQCEKRGAYRLYQSESMMLAVVAKQRFARSHRKEIETIIKAYKDAKVEWLKIKAERLRIEKEEEEKQRLIDEQLRKEREEDSLKRAEDSLRRVKESQEQIKKTRKKNHGS